MRKLIVGICMLLVTTQVTTAATMREFKDTFTVCQNIFEGERQHIADMLHNLDLSSMNSSNRGWVAGNIVEAAQYKINLKFDSWYRAFTHRDETTNKPEICRQEVQDIVSYINVETQKIINLR